MATLTLTSQPGFTEVPDSAFDGGNAVTAANMKAINADAKFAAVRTEEFWGYYKHGETVALPISPADGYAYTRAELRYTWSIYWSGSPPGSALNGTQTPPSRGVTSAPGLVLQFGANVDQATGVVECSMTYHKDGGETSPDTHDGILMILTHAKRSR
jgi:hypothetical protein